jgi:hypothetical protein
VSLSTAVAVYNRRLEGITEGKTGGQRPSLQCEQKRSWILTAVFLVFASCGKIADPKPPFVRIPERILDLSSSQNAYNVVLSWTNPAHNLDGSPAMDLATVHITGNGTTIADPVATGPGKPQAYSVPAQDWIGQSRSFNVWVETTRHKTSEVATVRAQPVDIPGAVANIKGIVDQYVIHITWSAPEKNPELVSGYFVRRTDLQTPPVPTTEREYKDSSFRYGSTYTYEVVAARQVESAWIMGMPSTPIPVKATDSTTPHTPTGLAIVVTETGAFVTWDANQELDLKGYFVFRNGVKVSKEPQTGNSFADPDYKPNTTYSVSAIDEFGNESSPSAPVS